jgi:hypothetical protein
MAEEETDRRARYGRRLSRQRAAEEEKNNTTMLGI